MWQSTLPLLWQLSVFPAQGSCPSIEIVTGSAIHKRGVTMTIATIIILLLTGAYWLLRPRSDRASKPKQVRSAPGARRSPYLATSVSFERCSCSAVKAFGETRFLTSGTVPKLPLAECSEATCGCRYVRHQDRRSTQGNRRAIYSLQTDLYSLGTESERRIKTGRRESDRANDGVADLQYGNFEWSS